MKYALLNSNNRILRTSDEEFARIPEGKTSVQITNARAATFEARTEPLFLLNGELVNRRAKQWAENPEQIRASIRPERNRLLAASDWTQLDDSPLTEAQKTSWATYRQQLRDLTSSIDENGNVTFPTAP